MSDEIDGIPEEQVPAPAGADEGDPDLTDDQADAAEDFLNGLLDILGIDGEARADIDEDEAITVEIEGPDLALLIGRHGATLDALQELTRSAVQEQTDARARLIVDVGGYRDRQQDFLERKARKLAADVRRSGRAEHLEPMSSFDRRIVHTALVDFGGVTTTSEGEGPDRHVVILPAPEA